MLVIPGFTVHDQIYESRNSRTYRGIHDSDKQPVSFKQAQKVNPEDKTADLYFKRCAGLMVQGVSDDWDGVEKLETK